MQAALFSVLARAAGDAIHPRQQVAKSGSQIKGDGGSYRLITSVPLFGRPLIWAYAGLPRANIAAALALEVLKVHAESG